MTIKGVLCDFFETGSEGTSWILQDEKYINAGAYSYDVKKWPSGTGEQLSFAGRWVHSLPENFDLGMWHRIFMWDNHDFTGVLHGTTTAAKG